MSFSKKDYLDFSLKYSFENEFFRISPSTALISNVLLLDYLRSDYQTLTKINSSAPPRIVGEKVSFNDVDQQTVSIKLNQSHSFLQGFVNDVPVTDKRDFKSQFLLTDGQLVP